MSFANKAGLHLKLKSHHNVQGWKEVAKQPVALPGAKQALAQGKASAESKRRSAEAAKMGKPDKSPKVQSSGGGSLVPSEADLQSLRAGSIIIHYNHSILLSLPAG